MMMQINLKNESPHNLTIWQLMDDLQTAIVILEDDATPSDLAAEMELVVAVCRETIVYRLAVGAKIEMLQRK